MRVHVLFCYVGDETTDKGGKNVVPCDLLLAHGCNQSLNYLFVLFEICYDRIEHPCLVFEFPGYKIDRSELFNNPQSYSL